ADRVANRECRLLYHLGGEMCSDQTAELRDRRASSAPIASAQTTARCGANMVRMRVSSPDVCTNSVPTVKYAATSRTLQNRSQRFCRYAIHSPLAAPSINAAFHAT